MIMVPESTQSNVLSGPRPKRALRGLALFAVVTGVLTTLPGCPPSDYEDVYGYNTFVLRNEGDRPILGLFIIDKDEPGRGQDFIEDEAGLQPERAFVVDQLDDHIYDIEIEYELTLEEMGYDPDELTDDEIADIEPTLVVEKLDNVYLFFGETYTWYWYRPSSSVVP